MVCWCENLSSMTFLAFFLNCVANSKIKDLDLFENVWIHPAPGDAGGAVGAALGLYYSDHEFKPLKKPFSPYLGPKFTNDEIKKILERKKIVFRQLTYEEIYQEVATYLHDGEIIGWFQDRMEWGPRALGNRSILSNATDKEMQKKLNLKIKYREGFRPFAPVVLEEDTCDYFHLKEKSSSLMQFTAQVKNASSKQDSSLGFMKKLEQINSPIPAVTHLDLSARVQTVNQMENSKLHRLITAYKSISNMPVIVNTSFNVRGEPIVCNPEDALNCFLATEIDLLVIENFIVRKEDLPIEFITQERVFLAD